MLTIDKIKGTVAKFSEKYGVKSAHLFGSYAKGNAGEDSDVDLIIEKGDVQSYDDYCDLKFSIEDELGIRVDLLTTEGVRPKFFEMIKNDRILLYAA